MSEGEYLYYEGLAELAEEDADQRDLDGILDAGGEEALASEMNRRFLNRYSRSAKVRRGRKPARCECCRKPIAVGSPRMNYAGRTGRLQWHEGCPPPHWFLRGFGWD